MPTNAKLEKTAIALVTVFIMLAAIPTTAATLDVEIDGTTTFADSNAATEQECSQDAAVECGVDFMGSLNCGLCVTDVGTTKLETATFLASQAGLARKRSTATSLLRHEFFVPLGEAPYLSTDIVLAANVGVSWAIQGMMAAAGEASAEVEVVLTVTDRDTGSAVAVETLYENEVVAGIDPQATIGAGVLMPVPDGETGIDVGFEVGTEKKIIVTDGNAAVSFLVQRGHTYDLEVVMSNLAQVNVTGGLAVSSFTDAEDVILSNLPDLLDPRLWLKAISDQMIEFPDLPEADAIFTNPLSVPSFTSFDEFTGRVLNGGTEMPNVCIGKDCSTYSLSIPNVPSTSMPTIPGKVVSLDPIPFSLIGGLTSMSSVMSKAGIPDLTTGLKFSKLLENDWIKFNGPCDSPTDPSQCLPQEEAFSDGGVRITDMAITVQGDRHRESEVETDRIVADAGANREAVLTNANLNRDAVLTNDNSNRDAVLADADKNRKAIIADASTNTNTIVANADAMRDAILANDDANTEAIIANDNENTDLILELTQMLADDALRREIQNNLGTEQCEPWMVTPEYADLERTVRLGGQLEVVFEVMETLIDHGRLLATVDAKELDRAQADLDVARSLGPSEAKDVCRLVLKAYKHATVRGH